jgi:hypothetical protein
MLTRGASFEIQTPAWCPLRNGPVSLVLLGVGWNLKPEKNE